MTAIHQQKRYAQTEITERLRGYYTTLPRKQLESTTVQLARVIASQMTLKELQDWRERIRKVTKEAVKEYVESIHSEIKTKSAM